MKREIKFKAYHKKRKEIYNVYGFHKEYVFSADSDDGIGCDGNPDEAKHVELMEFTGFHDKNGKEIYEGDILSDWTETDEGMIQSKNQVFWCTNTGAWRLDNSYKQDKSNGDLLSEELENYLYEITGNIYETQIFQSRRDVNKKTRKR